MYLWSFRGWNDYYLMETVCYDDPRLDDVTIQYFHWQLIPDFLIIIIITKFTFLFNDDIWTCWALPQCKDRTFQTLLPSKNNNSVKLKELKVKNIIKDSMNFEINNYFGSRYFDIIFKITTDKKFLEIWCSYKIKCLYKIKWHW